MNDQIIIALISLIGTALGSLCGVVASNKLVLYRLERLEEKVEKHNQVIERVYRLETKVEHIESEVRLN